MPSATEYAALDVCKMRTLIGPIEVSNDDSVEVQVAKAFAHTSLANALRKRAGR